MALFTEVEPVTFKETINDEKWVDAMKEELASIEKTYLGIG